MFDFLDFFEFFFINDVVELEDIFIDGYNKYDIFGVLLFYF